MKKKDLKIGDQIDGRSIFGIRVLGTITEIYPFYVEVKDGITFTSHSRVTYENINKVNGKEVKIS